MNLWITDPQRHAEAQERLYDAQDRMGYAPVPRGQLYRVSRPDHDYVGWQGELVGFGSGFAWLRIGTVLKSFRQEDVSPLRPLE